MHKAVLILGSNQGDREEYIRTAIDSIAVMVGCITDISDIYESEAFGYDSRNKYLNQAMVVQTKLNPLALLEVCQEIEHGLGRVRSLTERYADRTIDIDILFYDSELVDHKDLTIPHPRIAEREFVLAPLMDIIPDFEDPATQQTIKQMWIKIKNISH